MKAYILPLVLVGFSFSLSSCGKKDEAKPNQTPVIKSEIIEDADEHDIIENVYSQTEFDSDVANLMNQEKALLDSGFKFKVVEDDEEGAHWAWDQEALEVATMEPKKVLVLLSSYRDALKTVIEKYGKPFALKQADGSLVKSKLHQELLDSLIEKDRLVERTIGEYSEIQSAPENDEKPATEAKPAAAPAPKKPAKSVNPAKPTAKPSAKPSEKLSKQTEKPVPPVPTKKPYQGSTKKQSETIKPAASTSATCSSFMAPIAKRPKYNCLVVGKYGSFDINVSTEMRILTARGRAWNHRGQRGVETKYSMQLAQYQVGLFTLNVAPLAAQSAREEMIKSTETCSANGVKIVTQIKPPQQSWGSPETTEVKPSKSGGLIILVKKSNMNLRLNCR